MVYYGPVPGRPKKGSRKERLKPLHSRTFLEPMTHKPVTVTQSKVLRGPEQRTLLESNCIVLVRWAEGRMGVPEVPSSPQLPQHKGPPP